MEKFILSVVAIAAFASYNVYRSNNNETEGMSDTMLANVEALAGIEGNKGRWIVTIYSPTIWKCKDGGGMCCPDIDC